MIFDNFNIEMVSNYFGSIARRFKRKKKLSIDDLDYTFKQAIKTFGIPYPDATLYKYFLNKSVISSLLIQIHNDKRLKGEDRIKIKNNFKIVFRKLQTFKSTCFIQYRILGYQGRYPNINLIRGACWYTNHNQYPILITKNNVSAEEAFSGSSELQRITRNELKMAACILCASASMSTYLYFTGRYQYIISDTILKKVPKYLKLPLLHELFAILSRFKTFYFYTDKYDEFVSGGQHVFVDFQNYLDDFIKLFDGFSIRNHLLMRTSFYLIKSVMLWKE